MPDFVIRKIRSLFEKPRFPNLLTLNTNSTNSSGEKSLLKLSTCEIFD